GHDDSRAALPSEAIGQLRSRIPGIHCVIAGRGSFLPELQTRVDVDGLGDVVTLAGFVPDDELKDLLRRASCVVIPSLYEPFGIVALEGMASGAPTVVARTGGLAEIVADTGAALLFEPGNAGSLAHQIAAVLNDPAMADGMCVVAERLLADRYSWSAIAEATVAVYLAAGANQRP
ncbi:MAG TPA: glycosyltransferase family 4 protein, partial [Ilumatobacteraceae bacterium]|nr:glycosyltransferase family 4 protein [Ilumatobacteraceae bacterium]